MLVYNNVANDLGLSWRLFRDVLFVPSTSPLRHASVKRLRAARACAQELVINPRGLIGWQIYLNINAKSQHLPPQGDNTHPEKCACTS